jgi:transcriptional regulator with XRE-family HTH domain
MNPWDDFAGRLRELGEAAGLTQLQLAEHAGLTEQGLGQIERGRRQPTWETVCRLAAALGVTCEAFARTAAPISPRGPGRPRKPEQAKPPVPAAEEPPPAKGSGRPRTKAEQAERDAFFDARDRATEANATDLGPEDGKAKPKGKGKK